MPQSPLNNRLGNISGYHVNCGAATLLEYVFYQLLDEDSLLTREVLNQPAYQRLLNCIKDEFINTIAPKYNLTLDQNFKDNFTWKHLKQFLQKNKDTDFREDLLSDAFRRFIAGELVTNEYYKAEKFNSELLPVVSELLEYSINNSLLTFILEDNEEPFDLENLKQILTTELKKLQAQGKIELHRKIKDILNQDFLQYFIQQVQILKNSNIQSLEEFEPYRIGLSGDSNYSSDTPKIMQAFIQGCDDRKYLIEYWNNTGYQHYIDDLSNPNKNIFTDTAELYAGAHALGIEPKFYHQNLEEYRIPTAYQIPENKKIGTLEFANRYGNHWEIILPSEKIANEHNRYRNRENSNVDFNPITKLSNIQPKDEKPLDLLPQFHHEDSNKETNAYNIATQTNITALELNDIINQDERLKTECNITKTKLNKDKNQLAIEFSIDNKTTEVIACNNADKNLEYKMDKSSYNALTDDAKFTKLSTKLAKLAAETMKSGQEIRISSKLTQEQQDILATAMQQAVNAKPWPTPETKPVIIRPLSIKNKLHPSP